MNPKSKRLPAIVLGVAAILVILCTALYVGFGDSLNAYRALKTFWDAPSQRMNLSIHGQIADTPIQIDGDLDWTTEAEQRIACLELEDICLYFCDNTLYLDNGKAFLLSENAGSSQDLMPQVAGLLQAGDLQAEKQDTGTVYSISNLHSIIPEGGSVSLTDAVCSMTSVSGNISEMSFTLSGSVDGTPVSIHAKLTVVDSEAAPIPDAVLQSIQGGTVSAPEPITTSLLRLLTAWQTMEQQAVTGTQIALRVDCGILNLNQDLEVYRTRQGSQEIFSIGKNGTFLHLEGGGQEAAESSLLALPGMIYTLCKNADMEIEAQDGVYDYRLSMTAEQMAQIVRALVPDTEGMEISYLDGSLEIVVEELTLRSVTIRCSGDMPLLLTTVPVTIEAALTPIENPSIEIPQ